MAQQTERQFTTEQRDKLAGSGAALPDGSFPIVSKQDLLNAVKAIGRASDPAKAKAHIIKRAKALGLTKELPEDWTVRESLREAVELLIERCQAAQEDTTMVSDIRFGLDTLLEAGKVVDLPSGRKGTLLDLKHKLEKVEAEHSPEVIKTLSTALQAFLDEELGEPENKKESDMQTEAKAEEAKCEACGAKQGTKEVLPPVMEAAVEPKDEEKDETKDDETAEEKAAAKEKKKEAAVVERPKKQECKEESMAESIAELRAEVQAVAQQLKEARAPQQRFTEADRRELDQLRQKVTAAEVKGRAESLLKEAGLVDIYTADELMEFKESQWKSIVKTWENAMPPQRFGVPQVTGETAAATPAPASSEHYFRSIFAAE